MTQHRAIPRVCLLMALVACGEKEPDELEDPTPVCDGMKQELEAYIDAPFDDDGDGFFDGSEPGCTEAHPFETDCDDLNPLVNPNIAEIQCNGLDDDCNEATAEDPDEDGDGVGVCEDCNDAVASVFPGAEELCFDGRDNDCDGIEDNDCGPDYNGTWQLDTPIFFGCDLFDQPLVNVDFDALLVTWLPPFLTVSPATGFSPQAMDGTIEADGAFALALSVGSFGSCIEDYILEGTFTSETTMEGFFSADLTQSFPLVCGNCDLEPMSWTFTATRAP